MTHFSDSFFHEFWAPRGPPKIVFFASFFELFFRPAPGRLPGGSGELPGLPQGPSQAPFSEDFGSIFEDNFQLKFCVLSRFSLVFSCVLLRSLLHSKRPHAKKTWIRATKEALE